LKNRGFRAILLLIDGHPYPANRTLFWVRSWVQRPIAPNLEIPYPVCPCLT
jgi:hypothetical protein